MKDNLIPFLMLVAGVMFVIVISSIVFTVGYLLGYIIL